MPKQNRMLYSLMGLALAAAGGAFGVVLATGSQADQTAGSGADEASLILSTASSEPIQPIPVSQPLDQRKVTLGEKLFHDPRLSRDNSIACASCHDLARGGTDQAFRSTGVGGALGDINTPTVYNSSLNFRQFWDGRAETLEDQIDGPMEHPKEMGSTWPQIVDKLQQDRDYVAAFAELYAGGIQPLTIKHAIATYERSLLTPHSRFDRFLRGDRAILSDQEQAGYRLFKDYGCVACHQGANVGGNMYQVFGVMGDYFADRNRQGKADLGRYNLTGHEHHRHVFKVPGLRNVALTAPYFHDGSVKTLAEAVRIMAKYQVGRTPSPTEVEQIVAFLRTLTGEYQGRPL